MSRRPAIFASDLALMAVTVLATLVVQRQLSPRPPRQTHAAIPFDPLPAAAPAAGPLQTFFRKWKDVLLGTWRRIDRDRILANAAGVVFYGLLAIFPRSPRWCRATDCSPIPRPLDNLQTLALMLPKARLRSCGTRSRACWPSRIPRSGLRLRPAVRDLERERRCEGHHRCPQRRLRG